MYSKMTANTAIHSWIGNIVLLFYRWEPKKKKAKHKLSEQLEQEQNHRNGDHMEGYQQGSGRGREWERYRE